MDAPRALVVATLRHNITIASDVDLAEREFKALLGAGKVRVLGTWKECADTPFARLPSKVRRRIQASAREREPIGFIAEATASGLDTLIAHAAFLQDIGMVTEPEWRPRSPLARAHPGGVFSGIPASTLTEYACQLVQEPTRDARARLDALLAFLLTGEAGPYAHEVERAIESKKTTLALTHDLHIYKAKFFPRMIRALTNLFATDIAGGAVLDPFSGSGTALLETSGQGVRSFGTDLDPLATLISRCKVEPFTRGRRATRELLQGVRGDLDLETPLFRSRSASRQPSVLPEELRSKLERQDVRNRTKYLAEIEGDLLTLLSIRSRWARAEMGVLEVLLSDAVTKKVRYRFVGVGNGRYTIETVKQPILDRLRNKVHSTLALCDVFEWLEESAGIRFASSMAAVGDATTLSGVPRRLEIGGCITSPPYLPASSGREHYASARSLALAITGLSSVMESDKFVGAADNLDAGRFDPTMLTSAGRSLLKYLLSDGDKADPQRDAMRFARKAVPSWRYLLDIENFLAALRARVGERGVCLMVVASQHTFYSHRRLQEAKANGSGSQAIEYVARGRELYGELAERAGWALDEEIRMELAKASTSMARPRSRDEYAESVLVLRPKPETRSTKSKIARPIPSAGAK